MKRIYELDLLRGIGILLVVFFHAAWNICYKYNLSIINEKWVMFLVYFFAGMLIFVSGASSYLGKNTLKRGILTFICGMGVTGITYFVFPESYIKFGILHLLGFCQMVAWVVKKKNMGLKIISTISAVCIIIGLYAGRVSIKNEYLFWIGFLSENYSAVDHYPILPWLGIFLAGFAFSKLCYKDRISPFTKGIYKKNILTLAGRNSLIVYLAHQPIIYLLMFFSPFEKILDLIFSK